MENFFKASNVSIISEMIYECGSLQSIDLSNLYTPFLSTATWAFRSCSSLETIELPTIQIYSPIVILVIYLRIVIV